MRHYYEAETTAKSKDVENIKIAALSKVKLQTELREFELLRDTFSAARIFFHD